MTYIIKYLTNDNYTTFNSFITAYTQSSAIINQYFNETVTSILRQYIQDISKNFEFENGSRDCNKK